MISATMLPIMLATRCEDIRETVGRAEEHRQAQQIIFYLLVASKLANLIQNGIKIHRNTFVRFQSGLIANSTETEKSSASRHEK